MRRRVAVTALALCLLGCEPSAEPVALLHVEAARVGCSIAGGYILDIIEDPAFGTAAGGNTKAVGMVPDLRGPIWWPAGYIGRRVGSDVVVYDAEKNEVARTGGQRYFVSPPFDISSMRGRIVACWISKCDEACAAGAALAHRAVAARHIRPSHAARPTAG